MKLSEYIFNSLMDGAREGLAANRPPTEEDIERWIVKWYESEFNWQGKKKRPPMWLANWKRFLSVAPERSVVEQERCGIDEG